MPQPAKKGEEMVEPPHETASRTALGTLQAIFCPSIWPFYLSLSAIIAAGAFLTPHKAIATPIVHTIVATPKPKLPPLQYHPPAQIPRQLPPGAPNNPRRLTHFFRTIRHRCTMCRRLRRSPLPASSSSSSFDTVVDSSGATANRTKSRSQKSGSTTDYTSNKSHPKSHDRVLIQLYFGQ